MADGTKASTHHASRDGQDAPVLPYVQVVADQLVAGNLRTLRRAAGLTQAELGDRIGVGGAEISDLERSASGDRRRRFTAHDLIVIAAALGVPVMALLLPPEDDGTAADYQWADGQGDLHSMGELATLILAEPSEDDTPVADAYRARYAETVTRYLDLERGGELVSYLEDLADSERRSARLDRLGWQAMALRSLLDDITRIRDAITGERP